MATTTEHFIPCCFSLQSFLILMFRTYKGKTKKLSQAMSGIIKEKDFGFSIRMLWEKCTDLLFEKVL